MKKVNVFLTMIVSAALFIACTNEMDEWHGQDDLQTAMETRGAMTIISLASELDAFTLNSTNGIATIGGYYWNQTYTNTNFQTANFRFSHTANASWNYWDGFTVSNVADTTNYGNPSSSVGWLDHQWGSMAVPTGTTSAPNFLVGYWGYYMLDYQNPIDDTTIFGESNYSNWVKLGNDAQSYSVSKVTISIHPWPFYGVLYGDGFARPFKPQDDHFDLIIYGVRPDGSFIEDPITYSMAYYVGNTLMMSTGWEDITIDFDEPLKYLVFQMFTTDADPIYGPNTAVYFCLRDIVME